MIFFLNGYCLNTYLFTGQINREREIETRKHRIGFSRYLGVMYQVPQTLVHRGIKESEVMPVHGATENEFQDVAVEEQGTHLVLKQAQAHYSVGREQTCFKY